MAISDANIDLKEKLAYEARGKRRVLDGSGTPDDLGWKTDSRCFTDHEMLNQLDLVHMNGRVFDLYTARFLSGDALIHDPTNGYIYNRYSYVLNDTTNLIRPSGIACSTKANIFDVC